MKDQDFLDLCKAITLLENVEETSNFLRDLCTPQEINALSERWKVCKMLAQDKFSYRQISITTGASLTTIGRVARFLRTESYKGYQKILKKIGEEK
jgi:TrpR-related protein YerC/YecD